jgi:hypothetical protein
MLKLQKVSVWAKILRDYGLGHLCRPIVASVLYPSKLMRTCLYPKVIVPKVQSGKTILLLFPIFLLLVTTTVAQTQKPLTNDDILQMVKEGFTEEVIIKAIEVNKSDFDTSLPELRKLKNAGLNEKIINAMLSASSRNPETPKGDVEAKGLPEEIGVYLKEGEKLTEILPEIVNLRTGGFLKSIATYGVSGGQVNGVVNNPHSPLKTSLPIELIIRCPGISITQYQLLKLDEKKDRREFRALSGNIVNPVSGGSEKHAVPFQHEKIANATFKIKLNELKKGEYGILPPDQARIYTFGIE